VKNQKFNERKQQKIHSFFDDREVCAVWDEECELVKYHKSTETYCKGENE